MTVSFFSGCNKTFPPQKKTAYFPPEPKTDTTAQPTRQTIRTYFFPVVIKLSRHNKKTAYFPPEPETDTTAQPARQTTRTFFSGRNKLSRHNKKTDTTAQLYCTQMTRTFFTVVITIAHPPDRQLYLFFSGRNNDRAPARQTTVSFFSGGKNERAPARQMTVSFFFGRNNDRDRKKKKFQSSLNLY